MPIKKDGKYLYRGLDEQQVNIEHQEIKEYMSIVGIK